MDKKGTWKIGVSKTKVKKRGLLKTLETFCTTKQNWRLRLRDKITTVTLNKIMSIIH